MEPKINTVLAYLTQLEGADLDLILKIVSEMAETKSQKVGTHSCPHCGKSHVIKYGRKDKKQRFLCHDCGRTFTLTSNTVMANSHYSREVWAEFIRDTVYGVSLNRSAKRFGFSHQTAFSMRHKLLLALEMLIETSSETLSGTCELDETFVLDSCKGKKLPEEGRRNARKHGAKAQKPGISIEYVPKSVKLK